MTDQTADIEKKLVALLGYDAKAGKLWWKQTVSKKCKAGQSVGGVASNGRIYFQLDGHRFMAHRVVWFLTYGKWPECNLSAKDGDYTNLRLDNYEELDALETARKGSTRRTSKSGIKGVVWDESRQKWMVYITRNYKQRYVGRYADLEEAKQAYKSAAEKYDVDLTAEEDRREMREKARLARLTAKQRVVWKRVLQHAGGVTGWPSFREFAADLGTAEPTGHVVIPVDPDKPVGPANFQWADAPSKVYDKTDPDSRNAYYRKHREDNPALYRNHSLKLNFGIDLVEYQRMLIAQKGVCAICGNPETDVRNGKVRALAVDHCHASGKIRALLCGACNKGIGYFQDDVSRLAAAIAYLQKYQQDDGDSNVVPFAKT